MYRELINIIKFFLFLLLIPAFFLFVGIMLGEKPYDFQWQIFENLKYCYLDTRGGDIVALVPYDPKKKDSISNKELVNFANFYWKLYEEEMGKKNENWRPVVFEKDTLWVKNWKNLEEIILVNRLPDDMDTWEEYRFAWINYYNTGEVKSITRKKLDYRGYYFWTDMPILQ